MAKNNAYINQVKNMAKYFKGDKMVEDSMAMFAVTLFKYTNMEVDDINKALEWLLDEWNNKAYYGYDAVEYCKNETGIDIRGVNNDKK